MSDDQERKDWQRQKARRRSWVRPLAIALGVVAVLAIALGAGLGAGYKKQPKATPNHSMDTSAKGWNATLPSISRGELVGDADRWLTKPSHITARYKPVTREFNWTVTLNSAAPGAMVKPVFTINGQSPGPLIEANLGDTLVFHVLNKSPNSTAIHWHGQLMNGTPDMDGSYGITQCGIPPGQSMTYNWTVQHAGTSWYHAHRGEQYTDGLYGALVFHAPNETKSDGELTLLVGDIYNTPAPALAWRYTSLGTGIDGQPGDEPSPDGGVINGYSQAKCAFIPASNSVIPERRRALGQRSLTQGTLYNQTNECGSLDVEYFSTTLSGGKTYRLRLANIGSFTNTVFSVDGHNLTVIAVDGVPIKPLHADSVNIAVAQRYDVLLTLDQEPGAYWMRSIMPTDQMLYVAPNFNDTTLGVLRYDGVDCNAMPANISANTTRTVDNFSPFVPKDKINAPPPTTAQVVQFNMQYTADNNHYMFFNASSWAAPKPGTASLFAVADAQNNGNGTVSAAALGEGLNFVNNDADGVMDLVVNSLDDGDHPFHLHGHTFWLMSMGSNHFYSETASLNTTNPMRRDTVIIPSFGHVVMRFRTDNVGVWAFHCHIGWHMSIGLLLTVTNQPDAIAKMDFSAGVKMCALDGEHAQ